MTNVLKSILVGTTVLFCGFKTLHASQLSISESAEKDQSDINNTKNQRFMRKVYSARNISASDLNKIFTLAEAGNHLAIKSLAYRYNGGLGVKQDFTQALKWYKRELDFDKAWGAMSIGKYYQYGKGVEKNYATAVSWLSQVEGVKFVTIMARIKIASLYLEGDKFLPQNAAKAEEWLNEARQLAESGKSREHASCQYRLGCILQRDGEIPAQPEEAVYWLRKAADNGNSGAYSKLAAAYYSGLGTKKDLEKALDCLREAHRVRRGSNHLHLFSSVFEGEKRSKAIAWYNANKPKMKMIGKTLTADNALTADKHPDVLELEQRLKLCNPSSIGINVLYREKGDRKVLKISSNKGLLDISPVAATKLTFTDLDISNNRILSDLSPLSTLSIKKLQAHGNSITDLSPLIGLPLEYLSLGSNKKILDLGPLAKIKLEELYIPGTNIDDLSRSFSV